MNKGKFYDAAWIASDVEHSKRLVFDYEAFDFEKRWENETQFTIDLIDAHTSLDHTSRVLDYGSGVGRLAKPVIERFGCCVDAYEPSADLRLHAKTYVGDERYQHVTEPQTYDLIICAWVALLIDDVDGLYDMFASVLKPTGMLLVIDYEHQLLTDDGINYKRVKNGKVKSSLERQFDVLYTGNVPDKYIDKQWVAKNTFSWNHTFWAVSSSKPKYHYEYNEKENTCKADS